MRGIMRIVVAAVVGLGIAGVTAAAAEAAGAAARRIQLQDAIVGDRMPGWEQKGGTTSCWDVKDGVLRCTGARGGSWFGTVAEYTDFVLELEVKIPPSGNSGIFIRVPKGGDPVADAMEIQILDDDAEIHRNIQPWQRCGSLYHIQGAIRSAARPLGEWNHYRITAEGDHITVVLNGQVVVDAKGDAFPEIRKRSGRGSIGLQNHGTEMHFRNIRLGDLGGADRTAWFRDAKFGLFIHWGVYSVLGEGEWIMLQRKIKAAEYEKLPPKFNPTDFDAAAWAELARRSGVKYVVVTSKHHDGFAMYDSKASDYDIVDKTPYGKDPMKPLAEACANEGLRFGFYHSILDWHHPEYAPVPEWDQDTRAAHTPDFDKYMAYMQAMVRELCTNYGPLACIWWDGGWDHKTPEDLAKFAKVNAMIRELQPGILINNRANIPEDFDTPEQYIPPTGITNPDGSPKLWENCITLTTGHGSFPPTAWWGYDKNETEFKTPEYCIRMLVDIVSKGGNLLLNVGPGPTGRIRPEEVRVLKAMGRWLQANGEAIYGTTASPFKYLPFYGKATVKGERLYLHVFTWPSDGRLVVPGLKNVVRAARLLRGSETLSHRRLGRDVEILLPANAPDAISSTVVLELDGPPQVEPYTVQPAPDGTLVLTALHAELRGQHGQRIRYESRDGQVHIGNWTNAKDHIAWSFELPRPGTYELTLQCAAGDGGGGTFTVEAGDQKLQGTAAPTSGFAERAIGRLTLPAGATNLVLRPATIAEDATLMQVRSITLKPAS